jgi:sigma-54 dependent transcriptional regulator, acetoin dehydrogenase operon transcriptional activator AcoR
VRNTEQVQHIKNVMAVTTQPGKYDDANCTDLIHKSWARCINDYGLDPARPKPARIVTSDQLRAHQEQIEEFMLVARVGMEQMYKRVSGLEYVLLLTDANGIAVDYIGSDARKRELKSAGLYLGADWSETYSGTCGVGTCLVEKTALTCHKDDHFDATHIDLTCTSAPLFDPEGKFLAVLDMSALRSPESKESQHLALHLTVMYAQMIEDANFLRHFRDRWILRLGTTWELVEVSGEVMIAFDEEGVVVGANTGARQLFASGRHDRDNQPVGRHLTSLFRWSIDEIWRIARSSSYSDRSVITSESNQLFYASIVAPRRKNLLRSSATPSADGALSTTSTSYPALDRLAGDDKNMRRLLDQAKRLLNRKLNILIHGETGTGKEVIAKALHESSLRAGKPFIAVNCAAIPESLIESELFGYSAGTFTGGRSKGMKGLILQSDGGTLFLDEIGDMPLHLQTRLLRVLSEGEVLPLGAEKAVPLELTVIAASHRDLRNLISSGSFREDIYYRLCGATLHLPSLRDRTDKRFLIEKVLAEESELLKVQGSISPEAMSLMLHFPWPGNIRQLRNVLRFALAISEDNFIVPEDLPHELGGQVGATASALEMYDQPPDRLMDLGIAMESEPDIERLLASLKRHKWNITLVSDELEICRATVYRQMKKFGIVSPNRR